jgi:ribosomal protein L20A (L18A)
MLYAHKFYKNIEATEEVVLLDDVLEMMDSRGSLAL